MSTSADAMERMTHGHDGPLYFLAFDHRGAFARAIFDEPGEPTPAQELAIEEAKALIFAGLDAARRDGGIPAGAAGILVDERYGAGVAREALASGVVVAMPLERPDCQVFELAYGEDWRAHVEAFDPTFAKVLVRHNVEGDRDGNRTQLERLRGVSAWLREQGRRFLFELIVDPTPAQLEGVGGDRVRFERELRPALTRAAMAEVQDAGIEVDVWKLEGIDDPADAEAIVRRARSGAGREHVVCTILGAGAGESRVDGWLRTAAAVEGFAGFAIGRSIWRDPVRAQLAGTFTHCEAVAAIAARYRRFVDVYESSIPAVA